MPADTLMQRLKAGLDRFLMNFDYYPATTMFALQDQHVARVDQDRIANEKLTLELAASAARIEDIRAIRDEQRLLPNDAPTEMVRHIEEKKAAWIDAVISDADRRQKAKAIAQQRPRNSQGRFLPTTKETP